MLKKETLEAQVSYFDRVFGSRRCESPALLAAIHVVDIHNCKSQRREELFINDIRNSIKSNLWMNQYNRG